MNDIFNILFICTGNTCRSPMACEIFKKILCDRKIDGTNCQSAGISCEDDEPASPNAVEVCKEIGVDLLKHKSTNILNIDLDTVDLFVVMTPVHGETIKRLGVDEDKIYILGSGIVDPYGTGIGFYKTCRDEIKKGLLELLDSVNLKGE